MQVQGGEEKRRYRRFPVRDKVFVKITGAQEVVGEVINFSEGGVGLKYLAEKGLPLGKAAVDLFGPGGKSYVRGVPAMTVFDFQIPTEKVFPTFGVRRMGVAFGPLTDTAQDQLHSLITEHGVH